MSPPGTHTWAEKQATAHHPCTRQGSITHTHIYTWLTHTLRYCGLKSLKGGGGHTLPQRNNIHTETYAHSSSHPNTHTLAHTHTLADWENWSPNLVWLSNGWSCVYMEPCNLCLSVTAEFCTLIGVQIRCISPLCAPPLWQIGKMCKHQLTTVRNF